MKEKTIINDRRHATIIKGEAVVNMAMSLSYANLYRKYDAHTENKNIENISSDG